MIAVTRRALLRGAGLSPVGAVSRLAGELVTGPAAVLYGRIEPGAINLVTKQRLAAPYHSLQQQLGGFDFYRTKSIRRRLDAGRYPNEASPQTDEMYVVSPGRGA